MFSLRSIELNIIPNGIASGAPIIIGETMSDSSIAKYINIVTPTPIDKEKVKSDLKYFFGGISNFQKGIKQINTIKSLNAPNNNGGTLASRTNLPTTKALPKRAILSNVSSRCLVDKIISLKKDQELAHQMYNTKLFLLLYNL